MTLTVLLAGYLAVIQRLRVAEIPHGDGVGAACPAPELLLTADAPLVGAHLSGTVECVGLFSHPGSRHDATAEFLADRMAAVHFGPEHGDPLEIELLSDAGERLWFNWPDPGSCSLRELLDADPAVGEYGVVYTDAYPWLAPITIALCERVDPRATMVVNFGSAQRGDFLARVRTWTDRYRCAAFVPQLSLPWLAPADRASTFELLAGLGCSSVVVTSGPAGLGVGDRNGYEWWTPPHMAPDGHDTGGAGAAVSAALVTAVAHDSRIAATDLGLAGFRQCLVSGPLPADAVPYWHRRFESAGPTNQSPSNVKGGQNG